MKVITKRNNFIHLNLSILLELHIFWTEIKVPADINYNFSQLNQYCLRTSKINLYCTIRLYL